MKRVLLVAHVASMIDLFNMENIRLLQNNGCKVEVACNFIEGNVTSDSRIKRFKEELSDMGVEYYHIPFPRRLSSLKALTKSYRLLRELLNKKQYDIIQCQSPIAGAITRLTCAKVRTSSKVIYIAHGFHFYKGASLKNWLLYYNVEKKLAKDTDVLITINQEDYNLAVSEFKTREIELIPGVGIHTDQIKLSTYNRFVLLGELNIPNHGIILTSVGELNSNKNHKVIIEAIAKLSNKDIYYLICGQGPLEMELRSLAEQYGLEENVRLLGFREDIYQILKSSDIFVFPSYREGLSVAMMEAMACELPIICSNIRGNNDLVQHGQGGYLVSNQNIDEYATYIGNLTHSEVLRRTMGKVNGLNIKHYDYIQVNSQMNKIYKRELG